MKKSGSSIAFWPRDTPKMWVPLWTLLSISSTWAQSIQTGPEGARFEWGWSLQSPDSPATTGQYYVRLPQSEQRVSYSADNSGYHTAVAINTSGDHHTHEAHFALGDQALRLLREQVSQQQQPQIENANASNDLLLNANERPQLPLDIYLLQQQYSPLQNQQFVQIHNPDANLALQYGIPSYYNNNNNNNNPPYYVVHHEDKKDKHIDAAQVKEPVTDRSDTPAPVLQVFKHLNCTDDLATERTTKLFRKNINGSFGAKTFRGTVNFRVEPERMNARSERVYMAEATTARPLTDDEGISKLVASTQDLITNDDLLTINHAFEKSYVHNDDIIKPVNKNNKAEQSIRYDFVVPKNQFTVRTKLGNILSQILSNENSTPKEQLYQANTNVFESSTPKEQLYVQANTNLYESTTPKYQNNNLNTVRNQAQSNSDDSFTNPIIVKDSTVEDFKEQVVNNIVSTVAPYLDEGYEVSSIKSKLDESLKKFMQMQSEDYEDSTSRPLSQNYLAPITVGLRLLNANDSETLNTVDGDHEGSDSELVPETIKSPVREKTIVEVQESIPLEITHINDVEHHEYLEDGRANDTPLDAAKSLYNRFVQALESSRKIQENMNEQLYKSMTQGIDAAKNLNDSEDGIEASANIQSEVEVRPDESNERRELVRWQYKTRGRNFIQPIVIEKEVPVTKYVDRVVEKPVPYPEKVEVVKEVDKPIVLPVPIQKLIDRPVEVTRYVDKPYPINVPQPFPIEVKVPYPIEKQIFVDRPVHVPYTVEKVVEKVQPVPVPTAFAIPVEVPVEKKVYYPFPIEKHIAVPVPIEKRVPYETVVEKRVPVPYPVEKQVPYPVPYETKVPVPYAVEKRVPYPVEKIVEKPVTVTKVVEKPVRVEVPVPQPVPYPVRYPQPYPVEKIVERKVPYPVHVDRIVEKRVPYQVPYPVETIVEKFVEKPVVVTKYVNKPYPVETKVPYPVEKIVEKKVPYPVQVPVEVKVPYPVEKIVEKPVHVPIKVPYSVNRIVPIFYSEQTNNMPQKLNPPRNIYEEQYQQYLRDWREKELRDREQREKDSQVQSTRWGNHYASSYQYINDTNVKHGEFKKTPLLAKYLSYITNNDMNKYQYYGPPPTRHSEDSWGRNSKDVYHLKLRRTDRTPKVTNLRIEYGFKPPLVPSIEVDLDGIPVNKEGQN